jgi:Protein of unknown function (DUF2878)
VSAPSSQNTIANLIRFLVACLALVIGTSQARADLGAFIAFLMIAMHFRTHPTLLAEYKTVSVTLVIGTLWEFCLLKGGVLRYEGVVAFSLVPMWVVTFWAALGTTFNGCLSWGKQHLFLIAVLGALTGPLMTYGGSLLGILQLQDPLNSYLIIASGWALLAPLLFFLADYFFRTSESIHRN